MKIGELAEQACCKVETIRYYEKEGLLQEPVRNHLNNYRQYGSTHLERLIFIRRCRVLDMTHEEIRALIKAREENPEDCAKIDSIIREHLLHVQSRIKELLALEQQLKKINKNCNANRSVKECGVLRKLEDSSMDDVKDVLPSSGHLSKLHSH